MKKLIVLLLIITSASALQAAEINFLNNPEWVTILKRAREEKKLIFFDAFATWCGPCKQMDSDVYTDEAVAKYFNSNFINVKYDMEKGEGIALASTFGVTAYPSLFFINEAGEIVHKAIGYRSPVQLITLGKEAADPSLIPQDPFDKQKATAATLSPAAFLEFSAAAEGREDPDYVDIAKAFLANQKDVLANDELIELLMNYVVLLPDQKMLEYIIANKAKIEATEKYEAADIKDKLTALTVEYAVFANTNEDGDVDLESIKTLLEKYIPEDAYFNFNFFKLGYQLDVEEQDQAFATFKEMLEAPADKVSFERVCQIYLRYGATMSQNGQLEKIFTLLDNYKTLPAEADKLYFKDLAKAVVYANLKDKENFRVYAEKLINNKDVPEEIKTSFSGVLEKLK